MTEPACESLKHREDVGGSRRRETNAKLLDGHPLETGLELKAEARRGLDLARVDLPGLTLAVQDRVAIVDTRGRDHEVERSAEEDVFLPLGPEPASQPRADVEEVDPRVAATIRLPGVWTKGFTVDNVIDAIVLVTCPVLASSASRPLHVAGQTVVWIACVTGAVLETWG